MKIIENTKTVVVDASAILAVLFCEPERDIIISLTSNCKLISPRSLPFEIGNAISSGFKKGNNRLPFEVGIHVIHNFMKMEIVLENVDFEKALEISYGNNIYAYDAYMIELAVRRNCSLFTLDKQMKMYASKLNVELMEI
jgi:predicted nucleic acid-binding protein